MSTQPSGVMKCVNPCIPTQTPEKINVAVCNHQADSHFSLGLMSDLMISKQGQEFGYT